MLWTAAIMHSANRFVVEPLIQEMDQTSCDFVPAVESEFKNVVVDQRPYSMFFNAKLLGQSCDKITGTVPKSYALVFTPYTLLKVLKEIGLFPAQDVRVLDVRQTWATTPDKSFHLYGVARKASVHESILANQALSIPLD